jgi:hypothetical protein
MPHNRTVLFTFTCSYLHLLSRPFSSFRCIFSAPSSKGGRTTNLCMRFVLMCKNKMPCPDCQLKSDLGLAWKG